MADQISTKIGKNGITCRKSAHFIMISGPLKILHAELPNGLTSLLTRPSTSINRFVLNILGETVGSFLGLYGPSIHRSFRFIEHLSRMYTHPAFRVRSSPFASLDQYHTRQVKGVQFHITQRPVGRQCAPICWRLMKDYLFTPVKGLRGSNIDTMEVGVVLEIEMFGRRCGWERGRK